jgi:predicted DNA-binding transcriptional regulator YafY
LEEADRCYTIDPGFVSSISPDLLQDFELAIRKHRQVQITYYTASRNEQRQRTVNPYHLYSALGSWFLLAFDHWRQAIRTFNMERIKAYQLLDQSFAPDPNFSTLPYLAQGFMGSLGGSRFEVAIQFDAYQARYIRERQWHPTQSMEELPEGGVVLRFQAGGLEAIKQWVMQYGSHAQVLEPAELRQAIAAEIKKMSQLYSD